MILSNRAIQDALDNKHLIIDPEPAPRKVGENGDPCPYQTSAVDLRLSNEINVWKSGGDRAPMQIDLSKSKFTKLPKDVFDKKTLADDDIFELKPGTLVLAKTFERIALPILPGVRPLAARVEGKSSYARCGVIVHFTAPTIHSGFDGTITLEMMNQGHYSITLRPKIFICQLVIEEVSGEPFANVSQFQGQHTPSGS